MRVLATALVVAALAATSAGAAVIGPWPAASSYTWDTQPMAGYTSGTVTLQTTPPLDQLWVVSSAVGKRADFTPYPGFAGEKLSLAKLVLGGAKPYVRAKLLDQGTGAGWSIVLKNSTGKIIDFGVRPALANGKVLATIYDGAAWAGNYYLASRVKNGQEYWDNTFASLPDGKVKIDVKYLNAATMGTASYSWTSPSAFGAIEDVYLCATTAASIYTTFKYTEFVALPEPSSLLALAAGIPMIGFAVRRRKA